MSEGNLELAREGYEVFNRGEFDRFLTEFVHPDYEFHTGVRVPSIPSVVRGRDELGAWIHQWYEEPWEGQLQMDVERIEDLETALDEEEKSARRRRSRSQARESESLALVSS